MPKAVMITSGKGGTGKSTVAQLLGRALAARDQNVLLVELDSGLRGLDLMLGVSDRVVYDLSDILMGRCKPARAIVEIPTARGALHLIPAANDHRFVPERQRLGRLLKGLWSCYDFLIYDTSAGLGFDVAASLCTDVLLVTNCCPVSARDAAKAASILQGQNVRLVVNRFKRSQLCDDIPNLDVLIDMIGVQLISVVPDDPLVGELGTDGPALLSKSAAAGEIDDLAGRLMGERILLNQRRIR